MKLFFAAFLLCSLLLSSSFLEPVMASCAEKCNSCANAGIQDRCLKSCGICGEQCKCVSSGTCENKYECSSETSKCSCCRDKYECSSETSKCSCCRDKYECSSETSKCSCCRDKYECSSETSKCSCCRDKHECSSETSKCCSTGKPKCP